MTAERASKVCVDAAPEKPLQTAHLWGQKDLCWMIVILLIGALVRVYGLNYSLWLDEIASSQFAAQPLSTLWSDWSIRETNPPFYYSSLALWTGLFGTSDLALRALSVCIGLASLPLLYLLGRELFGARIGLVAAALVCVSAQHVFYSQQVRGYILTYTAATGVMLTTAILVRLVREGYKTASFTIWALYVAGNLIAVYTHTIMVLLPALTALWLLWACLRGGMSNRPFLVHFALAHGVILFGWLWWGRITWLQMQLPKPNFSWITKPSLPYALRMLLETYVPWAMGSVKYVAALGAGVAMVAAVIRRPASSAPMVLFALGVPVILYVMSQQVPVFLPRTIFWASAAFSLLVAAGLCTAPRFRALFIATAFAIQIADLVTWWPTRQIEPWREIVAEIQTTSPSSLVIADGRGIALALQRYCAAPACHLDIASVQTHDDERWAGDFALRRILTPDAAASELRARGSVILVNWASTDPAAEVAGAGAARRKLLVGGLPESLSVTIWAAQP